MIVTVAKAKGYLKGLTASSTTEDAWIEAAIKSADGIIAARTGRVPPTSGASPSLESRIYQRDIRARSSRVLDLGAGPVASIVSAYVDSTGDYEGSEQTVTLTDIEIRNGHLARLVSTARLSWACVPRGNRVRFIAGWGGSTTVSGAHLAGATTITVASTAAIVRDDAGGGRVLIGSEVVYFTGATSTTLTGCTRGAEGTTAASISDGATVSQPAPDALQHLVCQLVAHLYDLRKTQGAQDINQGGASTTFVIEPNTIPAHLEQGIGAYLLSGAVVG